MRSPFPGMDPYIEARGLWKDFHTHLIEKIHESVSVALPPNYVVRAGIRSYIALVESEERLERTFEPDVSVTGPRARRADRRASDEVTRTAVLTPTEPRILRAFIDMDFEEKFLDIFEVEPERRLVTSIEILSPANKRRGSPGWEKYLRKRQALLLGKANLVELDLLRGGDRMPMLDPFPESPYYVLIAREERVPLCEVWPAFVEYPLPAVPIPLRRPDEDLTVSLQPMVEAIYERSRYGLDIDYSRPLRPPLSARETAGLEQHVQTGNTGSAASSAKRRPRRKK